MLIPSSRLRVFAPGRELLDRSLVGLIGVNLSHQNRVFRRETELWCLQPIEPDVNVLNDIERDGFAIVPRVLGERSRRELLHELEEVLSRSPAGVRGIAAKVRGVGVLAQSAIIRSLVEPVLGSEAQLVRSILFNKSDEVNWRVAWHQDLAVAVAERKEAQGYTGWSVKERVPHVQPPAHVLEHLLTVRLHLDRADETNGALWVSPGSHRLGRLPVAEAAAVAERNGSNLCEAHAGDALLLRPLLLHASRKATSSIPRRVIQEFSGVPLTYPLEWPSGCK